MCWVKVVMASKTAPACSGVAIEPEWIAGNHGLSVASSFNPPRPTNCSRFASALRNASPVRDFKAFACSRRSVFTDSGTFVNAV